MDDRRGAGATLDVPATAGIARAAVDGALPGALLLAKLGHELRSPLTGIVGLTRIMLVKLAEGAHTPGQQTHQLELMRASAVQLLDTIDRVVTIAKLEVTTSPADEVFDCRAAISAVVAQAAPGADAHARRLIVEVPDEPVLATGNEQALQRLLSELVDNAIKYTDQTDVRIRCSRTPLRTPMIEVSDDGPGMTVDEQNRVSTPFVRGAAAERNDVAGSGLGLYLAQQLTTACGAMLTVHSAPSTGSTFAIQLEPPAIAATTTSS